MNEALERIERIVTTTVEKYRLLQREKEECQKEAERLRAQLQEKEAEVMRLRRERQQAAEDLEREVAALREERSQMNQKLSELLNKLTSLSFSETDVDADSDR
ncbi:hypothetical protein [Acetomicrobium sp. S15 = DSM 107314]|jgi:FtsZ-binding cell division protein ZapB|uniref:hypothetical protein n=1 Tax=Acetomicrobium sp. S15 = DSM 107314 TaxID=2529858 RepID=UPI0018E1A13B|nr:hypothetical protein [Acetomicrobium sp. S15 = DSM 107314]